MRDPVSQSNPRRLVKTATPGIYRRGKRYVAVVRDADGRQVKRAAKTLAATFPISGRTCVTIILR